MTRIFTISLILSSAMLLASCGSKSAEGGTSGASKARAANVFVEPLQTHSFASRIEALGTLTPKEQVDLTLNSADRVASLYFEDGQRVKKGQVLLQLQQREQRALVQAEEARVISARQQLGRMERLVASKAVSQAEVDDAKGMLDSAIAQKEAVESRQTDRVLRAPFDGVLGFRRVSVGSYVQAGSVVARLVDDSEMNLQFDVPSTFLRLLNTDSEVVTTTNDIPGQTFKGTITSIDNVIDPVTRAVTVRATLANPDQVLVSGMFMNVTVNAEPRTVPALPEEAVQPVGPRNFVYTVESEGDKLIAKRKEIQIGILQDGLIEVKSGIEPGERIVIEGLLQVRDGAPVKIQSPDILNANKNTGGGGGGASEQTAIGN
ncbi:efflux RND transporter periplasmic adaptor subunit [Hellea sp.]|nr:efflux RND transporter periplasmic adaptor subunit [Hellea sp.]